MADVSASEEAQDPAVGPTATTASAGGPSVRVVRELLAALRRPNDQLLSVGLGNLANPDLEAQMIDWAAQVQLAARQLSVAFAKSAVALGSSSSRSAAQDEAKRRHQTATELLHLAEQVADFARLKLSDRQRLVGLGMRLCAAVSMHLPSPVGKNQPRGGSATRCAPKPPKAARTENPETVPDAAVAPENDDVLQKSLQGQLGIGPATAQKLLTRGVERVVDALYFLPKRYDDLRQVVAVGALVAGVMQTTVVIVERTRVVWARKRFLEAVFRGEDGVPLLARWFYFHGGCQKRLVPGKRFLLVATPNKFRGALQVTHPELTELVQPTETDGVQFADGVGQIRARYPDVEGVPARTVEKLCQTVCEKFVDLLPDGLPQQLLTRLSMPSLPQALRALHIVSHDTPTELLARLNAGLSPAQRRLIFEELFFLQLGLLRRRRSISQDDATVCPTEPATLQNLRAALPFTPTGAQERAIAEIAADLAKPHPMQRLLHGDVGSGKTLVAYAACEMVAASGYQAAFMAPTEILAEQHFKTLRVWARATHRKLALLTATTAKTARKTTLAQLQAGRFAEVFHLAETTGEPLDRETILAMLAAGFLDMVVGTHALLAEAVEFRHLALVVIDEQHRFGVGQRAALRKKGRQPHILVMTATPIPRTLALTLYGDLDVSQLDELPPGRKPPTTQVVAGKSGERAALEAVKKAACCRKQVFWVCPLIEESEKLELSSVTARHAALCQALPELRVGLVHGRLNSDERELVMQRFRNQELDVLVATTVIEVGVDVPNATVMVIESAERFGLAQLHQLRGRVGRGDGASLCLLLHGNGTEDEVCEPTGDPAETDCETAHKPAGPALSVSASSSSPSSSSGQRLAAVAATSDGFRLAEADLRLRGPGEVLGTRQSGLPPLRFADLLRDIDLLTIARREAASLLGRDPNLSQAEHAVTRQVLSERWQHSDLRLE